MLIHSVYFWLKPELTTEQRDAFVQGLELLRPIETVKRLHIGTPVPSDRPVVEGSYSYGLVIEFANQADLQTYAVHPTHTAFVEQFSPMWTQVRVFDFEG